MNYSWVYYSYSYFNISLLQAWSLDKGCAPYRASASAWHTWRATSPRPPHWGWRSASQGSVPPPLMWSASWKPVHDYFLNQPARCFTLTCVGQFQNCTGKCLDLGRRPEQTQLLKSESPGCSSERSPPCSPAVRTQEIKNCFTLQESPTLS